MKLKVFGIKVRSHFYKEGMISSKFCLKVGASLMCVWHLQHYMESQLNLSFGAKGLRIGLLFITV